MFTPLSRNAPDTRLRGVIGPLVTTFDSATGEIAADPFIRNISAHLDAGQSGVLVAGSTGEAALLDEGERATLLENARSIVPAGALLLAGIGGESTRITIRRARESGERGADAVLVVAPHYYTASMTREALKGHYTAVADSSPIPVLLYNIPKYAHFALPPDLVAELAEHPNIVGMKDSSGDLPMLAQYIAVQESNSTFSVLTGHGPTFVTALQMGVRGGILAVALYTGEITPRIATSWERGDHDLARDLHASIENAAREIVAVLGVPGVKCAMDAVGLEGGAVRSPLMPLSAAQQESVRTLVASLPATPSTSAAI